MSLDSFSGTSDIILQPNSTNIPFTFTFSSCSSATENDGYLPYASTISSVLVTAKKSDGTPATSSLIGESIAENNVVTVSLNYPTSLGLGAYYLEFVLTLASGAVIEADFKRVYAEDR